MSLALLDGHPATADDLRALALSNYGHFTAMQVRNRAVQGLALHVARLQAGTQELFDIDLPRERIVAALAEAIAQGPADASLRLTVFARAFDYRAPLRSVQPDLLVTSGPPTSSEKPAIRVRSFEFVRPLPHIKHVGTFPLFHLRRQAQRDGFDDALFVTGEGRMVEGSIWNIGFWDGESVIWPTGPALRGTSEQLLQQGLAACGVAQRREPVGMADIAGFRSAFATNASGFQSVVAIDHCALETDQRLLAHLTAALASQPWTPAA